MGLHKDDMALLIEQEILRWEGEIYLRTLRKRVFDALGEKENAERIVLEIERCIQAQDFLRKELAALQGV